MVRNRRRPDARALRSKGVIAIGKNIRKQVPRNNSKNKASAATIEKRKRKRTPTPTVADVPAGIRTQVVDIRRRYRGWGPQKNSIAASMIIAACGKNKANVQLAVNTMLRKPIHKQLRDTIRKQLQARQEKQNK